MIPTLLRPLALLSLLAPAAPVLGAQAQVWFVDPEGGPGVQFGQIQEAVDAAADGDLIVVRSGTYDQVRVVGKSLAIVEEEGAEAAVAGGFDVRQIAADQSVVLRGFDISGAAPGFSALSLTNNAGLVWGEDLATPSLRVPLYYRDVLHGISATRSSVVVLSRCNLAGGAATEGSVGGLGAWVSGSRVVAYDSVLRGGDGDLGYSLQAGVGGVGALVVPNEQPAVLFLGGSKVAGGSGGVGYLGSEGADGGDGLVVAGLGATAWYLDTDCSGGQCGQTYTKHCFQTGNAVLGETGGETNLLDELFRSISVPSPVRAGSDATLSYTGLAGDQAFALISRVPGFQFIAAEQGVLILDPAYDVVPLGQLSESGTLETKFPLAPLPGGLGGYTTFVQASTMTPDGTTVLGGVSALTVLNQSL